MHVTRAVPDHDLVVQRAHLAPALRRSPMKIAIVTGSVRPGRQSLNVANWVKSIADQRPDAEFEVVDIADFHLPVWDKAMPPSMGQAEKAHSKAWSAKMAEFDGYVFVVSEYNHS